MLYCRLWSEAGEREEREGGGEDVVEVVGVECVGGGEGEEEERGGEGEVGQLEEGPVAEWTDVPASELNSVRCDRNWNVPVFSLDPPIAATESLVAPGSPKSLGGTELGVRPRLIQQERSDRHHRQPDELRHTINKSLHTNIQSLCPGSSSWTHLDGETTPQERSHEYIMPPKEPHTQCDPLRPKDTPNRPTQRS